MADNTERISIDESNIFFTKGPYDDTRILTSDKVILYTSREWLYNASTYFHKLVSDGFSETYEKKIKLSFNAKVISTLFKCIKFGLNGSRYIRKQLSYLVDDSDKYDFLLCIDQYQIVPLKGIADKHFSHEKRINVLYAKYNLQLIDLVHISGMGLMKTSINKLLQKEESDLKKLDFRNMNLSTLPFFEPISF